MTKNSSLTKTEIKVLELAKHDLTNQEIAGILHISFHTVKAHLCSINRKLDTNTKLGAIIEAIKIGYVKM